MEFKKPEKEVWAENEKKTNKTRKEKKIETKRQDDEEDCVCISLCMCALTSEIFSLIYVI